MKNKFLSLVTLITLSVVAFSVVAQDEPKKEEADAHAGHSHQKIDKDSPEYKEYIKKQVEAHESYIKEVGEFDKSEKFNRELLEKEIEFDVNVGSADAPISIVEYASLSCGHCRNFHEKVYYDLKKEFIDKGLVKFKYRHYPLNGSAVKGALIVSCAPEESKQAILGGLFKGQGQWAHAQNESQLIDRLKTASMIAGMDAEAFKACYNDEATENKILENMKIANKELMVDSTPTIFIEGERYLKARDFESIKLHINTLLEAKKQSAPKE